MKYAILILFFLCSSLSLAQVKIGDDIDTIDGSSLLELQSGSKTLVLTRISNAEMLAITPLNGALIYNTDSNCIYYYNGSIWINLCDTANTGGMFSDNGDGTFTFTDSNGVQTTFRADDDITAVTFDGTDLTVDEGTTTFNADLSALEESADITANTTAIAAEQTRALAAEAAIQADVDTNETDADNGIAAVQADVDVNETDADNAIAAVQADVDTNEADANAAIALKEDSANKSTDITLADGTNTNFPTELAVKTYVDNQVGSITTDDDITGVSFDGTDLTVDEGTTTFSADLSALEESADITANTTAIAAEQTRALAAEAAIQADVDTNEADADAAIALKEDSANKSTDITLADGTNTNFPTELAVKTYVDNQVGSITTDDDITGVSFDGTDLTVDEGTTTFSADLSALEESADITANTTAIAAEQTRALAAEAAVQADVDANETDADNAIAAVQSDVDTNEADADAAIALKEDSANKSTDITLADGTNTNFPTELAVKTYVDNQVGSITTDDDITGVSFDGTDLTVDEGTTTFSADLSALEESADITANTTAIAAEQTRALAAEAAIQADVDTNETDADNGIAAVQADVDVNETDADNAIAAVQADVDTNEADADAAIALKEDSANKSTDITLADGTNTNFPTELAVKTYVDNQVGSITTDDDITGVSFDGTDLTVDEGTTTFSADLSALEESADITANTTAIAAEQTRALAAEAAIQADVDANETDADNAIASVQADVDTNEADADAAIAGVQADVDANETDADNAIASVQADVDTNEADADAAIALKEDSANKSTDITLADGTNTNFPTELAVKTYVDNQVGSITTDDDITGVSFDGTDLTVDEGTTTFSADLSALEESADITANTTAIAAEQTRALAAEAAIQADVDTNETDADNAIASVQADVDTNEADADAAIAGVQADVDANETDADNAIASVQADVDTNEADADAAIATNSSNITTNANAITAHNTADGDLSSTNELTDLAISGNTLTLTNPATGANSVTLPTLSGTEGSVFFADTDGTGTENNTQLFWDATNNRLGIGTNNPTHKLQVTGQVRATSFANADGTAGSPSYRFNSDGNTGMFRGAADQLAFSTGGTEAMRIDASGNLGIGTSTPDESLHIANNMRLDGSFEDKDGEAGTAGQILTSTATGTDWTDAPNETVTTLAQDNTTGVITYTNETPTAQTANVVSADANNSISVGTDGGAYFGAYEKIVIWAEENGGLGNDQLEWSFGNGATGQIGIPLPEDWEAYAVSFNADVNGGTDTVLMAVIDSNTNTNLFTFTATGNANNMVYTEVLAAPIAIPAGTSIGFRTVTETGIVSDARVAVFLRRRP